MSIIPRGSKRSSVPALSVHFPANMQSFREKPFCIVVSSSKTTWIKRGLP